LSSARRLDGITGREGAAIGEPESSARREDERGRDEQQRGHDPQLHRGIGPADLIVAWNEEEGRVGGGEAPVEQDREPDAASAVVEEGVDEGVADDRDERHGRDAHERQRVELVARLV
jgi:hypothetical protein